MDVTKLMQMASSARTPAELGLSPVLDTVSGQSASWSQRTVDISDYNGATAYLVFEYTNGASDFTGDIQLDLIEIGGNTYSFETSSDGFQKNSVLNVSTYSAVTWTALTTGSSGGGNWFRDSGGTPSTGTGLTTAASGSYYVYAETSSPANVSGYKFWLRSPSVVINSNTFSYYEARSGASMGTLNVYLDVTVG